MRRGLLSMVFAVLVLTVSAGCASSHRAVLRHEAYDAGAADRNAREADANTDAAAAADAAFAPAFFVDGRGARVPYRLMAPLPSPSAQRYPLVVFLHGSGAMGDDNAKQIGSVARSWAGPAQRERFRAFVLVPQVAVRSADYHRGSDGLPASVPGRSLAAVVALIDEVAETRPIDRDRIYLVGFSMGASAALNAVVEYPERFAAVAAFAPVPPERNLAARVAGVPMWLVHGSTDEENPYAADRAWVEALTAAGGQPVFVTIDGMGHEFPQQMLHGTDWRGWLFAQRLR